MNRHSANQVLFACGGQEFSIPLHLIPSSSPLKLNRGHQTVIEGNPLVFQVLIDYLKTGTLHLQQKDGPAVVEEEQVLQMARDYGIPLPNNGIDWRPKFKTEGDDGKTSKDAELKRRNQMQIYQQLEHLIFKNILPLASEKMKEYEKGLYGSAMFELSVLLVPVGFCLQDLPPNSVVIETPCERGGSPVHNLLPSMAFLLHEPVKELLLRILYQLFPSCSRIQVIVRTVSKRSENEFGLYETVSTPGLQIALDA